MDRNFEFKQLLRAYRKGIIDEATFESHAYCYSICNTNSPLQLDLPMTDGILKFAERGQLVIVTPFTLAGAMAPVTLAGALAEQNAEALAGMVLTAITATAELATGWRL